eukprot:SAG25_NODE_3439_length_1082_cov_21.683622_1_plen_20_part_10
MATECGALAGEDSRQSRQSQ